LPKLILFSKASGEILHVIEDPVVEGNNVRGSNIRLGGVNWNNVDYVVVDDSVSLDLEKSPKRLSEIPSSKSLSKDSIPVLNSGEKLDLITLYRKLVDLEARVRKLESQ